MWKRYDELTFLEKGSVASLYSGDKLVMGEKNVADVRRSYGYWCENGWVHCRKLANRITDWNQATLY